MSVLSFACSGSVPANIGVTEGRLAACPSTPNCVSSDASDGEHRIASFALRVAPREAWDVLRSVLSERPRTKIIVDTGDYMHVESRSFVFRFVDDVEFHLRAAEQVIAVRSAARLGSSDFGVNRKRVEDIRAELQAREVVD